MTEETIDAEKLRSIRAEWGMSQTEFAGLLFAPWGTYKGWEYGRPIPAQVQAHVQSIANLRLIYRHWDKIAQSVSHVGMVTLTGENLIAAINAVDILADDHEKLWGEMFPQLKRE